MSKKIDTFPPQKEFKFSYMTKQGCGTKTLQIKTFEKPILHKEFQRKDLQRLTDYNQNIILKRKNHKNIKNYKKIQINKDQKENINLNNQQIEINDKIEENSPEGQIVEINDLIGEKCNLDLELLELSFNNFEQGKTSTKSMGIIHAYAANTYQGLIRDYNEDRVSIIINMSKPEKYNKNYWPKTSFFGIYDGHGGCKCADFLRDNLHNFIFNDQNYPENVCEAIKNGFLKAEKEFLYNIALDKNNNMNIIDRSGSCAVIIIIIDKKIYVANVGDSRGVLSLNYGKKYLVITEDHKPNNENEKNRIIENGGQVYQTKTPITVGDNEVSNGQILLGPYRVLPGRLSVSRTIGDIEAKETQFGGNPNVIIPLPDIYCYDLEKDNIDFLILGCDGIYDQISSEEILNCAWMILKNREIKFNLHEKCGIIVDFILKASMARKSFDNITCLIIALRDNYESFNIDNNFHNNKNNHNINTNKHINDKIKEKVLKDIKEFKISPFINLPKESYNYRSLIKPCNNINGNNLEINKGKIKKTNLEEERAKIININKISNNKRKEKEKENNSKNKNYKNNKTEIIKRINTNNLKKILNKSGASHLEEKKTESERGHSKKTFVKKMHRNKYIQTLNNLENNKSPIIQRKSDINMFKIYKISNNIYFNYSINNKNLKKKPSSKYYYNYESHKNNITSNLSTNSYKKENITMNNMLNINKFISKEKRSKIANKSDLSCDNLIKNSFKNDNFNRIKMTEIKKNKNRKEFTMKLQNTSGISSFRNNLRKNEFNSDSKISHKNFSNTSEKIRQNSSSKRKQAYHQILNNLNFHFNIKRQNNIKNGQMTKKELTNIQRLTEKKLNKSKGEDLDIFLKRNMKNVNMKNNKKLKMDINYINNINNKLRIKKVKSGIKYVNSMGNNSTVSDNSFKNSLVMNKFHNILQKNSNQKYSTSSLNNNLIRQIKGKFTFH